LEWRTLSETEAAIILNGLANLQKFKVAFMSPPGNIEAESYARQIASVFRDKVGWDVNLESIGIGMLSNSRAGITIGFASTREANTRALSIGRIFDAAHIKNSGMLVNNSDSREILLFVNSKDTR
jgi:hypothetical protein